MTDRLAVDGGGGGARPEPVRLGGGAKELGSRRELNGGATWEGPDSSLLPRPGMCFVTLPFALPLKSEAFSPAEDNLPLAISAYLDMTGGKDLMRLEDVEE